MGSPSAHYDVVIIGGGINGAGIARDAATRGLKILLLEQNDFGSGTSSWSTRLVHGGLRYLEYAEFALVYESLRERRTLRRIAPHLVKQIRINIPVYECSKRGMFTLRLGMTAYDLLSIGKNLPRHRVLSKSELVEREPGVCSESLVGGVQYFDAQVAFAERLVVENIVAARMAGACVRNYSRVIAMEIVEERVRSVHYIDERSGVEYQARATVVVNATGPWVDRVLATAGMPRPQLTGGTKGSHIVVGSFTGAPGDAVYMEAQADARPFFVIPWNGQYLIGTTDLRYDGDPGEAKASQPEIRYLLSETNRVFPQARLEERDIHYAYAGVRPLPYRSAGPESAITRKHIVHRHESARNLLSVIGGKLTTYRNLAEQVTNLVATLSGLKVGACRTAELRLPGGNNLAAAKERLRRSGLLSAEGQERLLTVYGSRVNEIMDLAQQSRTPTATVDEHERILAAEIQFVIRQEFARDLTDILHRRIMVGLSPDLGASVAKGISVAAAAELGWDPSETARQQRALADYNARLQVLPNA